MIGLGASGRTTVVTAVGLHSLRPSLGSQTNHSAPHTNSFIKHFSNFIKMLRDFCHPSFKSLAQLKTRDSFRSRFKSLFSS